MMATKPKTKAKAKKVPVKVKKKPGPAKGPPRKLPKGPLSDPQEKVYRLNDPPAIAAEAEDLNERQLLFCQHLINGSTQVDAYRAAGYNASSDEVMYADASNLVRNPKVQAQVAMLKRERDFRLNISGDRTIWELARIGYIDTSLAKNRDGTIKELHEMDPGVRAAVASFEVDEIRNPFTGQLIGVTKKLHFHPKVAALTQLAKIQGLCDERDRLTVNVQQNNANLSAAPGGPAPDHGRESILNAIAARVAALLGHAATGSVSAGSGRPILADGSLPGGPHYVDASSGDGAGPLASEGLGGLVDDAATAALFTSERQEPANGRPRPPHGSS